MELSSYSLEVSSYSLSAALFCIYILVALLLFKLIPTSLSDTYYLYENKKKNAGIVFVLSMMIVAMSIAPVLFTLSEGNPLQFLGFFTVAGLAFVGAAPRFKGVSMESIIHPVAAIICATSCLLWIILVSKMWYIIPIVAVIMGALMCITKTFKSYTFWLEMAAFISLYTTLLLMIL